MRISDWSSDVCSSDLAVDAAQVNERTVIGDVLDDAFDHLALGEALDQARTLLGAGFLEHRAARDDDVAALAVHLQDLERLRHVHQRGHVAHRADIDLAAGPAVDGPGGEIVRAARRERGWQY